MNTMDWWTTVIGMDVEYCKKVMSLFGENIKQNTSIEERVMQLQSDYISLKTCNDSFKRILEADEKMVISVLPPNSGIVRFIKGKGKGKYNKEDYKHFVFFLLWVRLRITVAITKDNKYSLEDLIILTEKSFDDNSEKLYRAAMIYKQIPDFDETQMLLQSPKFLQQIENYIHSDDNQVDEQTDLQVKEFIVMVLPAIREFTRQRVDAIETDILYLFRYMTLNLLGKYRTQKIEKILRESSLNKEIQLFYDLFIVNNPTVDEKFWFSDTIHHQLKTGDFEWKKLSTPLYFYTNWSRQRIQMLYDALISLKYMDPDTDVRDFCRVLTSYKPKENRKIKRICWIHKDKWSLALFIGELKKRNQLKMNWSNIPDVFDFKGNKPSFHSSTDYNQALNSGHYNDIIKAFEEIEKRSADVNNMEI